MLDPVIEHWVAQPGPLKGSPAGQTPVRTPLTMRCRFGDQHSRSVEGWPTLATSTGRLQPFAASIAPLTLLTLRRVPTPDGVWLVVPSG